VRRNVLLSLFTSRTVVTQALVFDDIALNTVAHYPRRTWRGP